MSATSMATPPAASARSIRVGMTGIPIVNVNNNCSTGSTALFLARQAIESGAADCVLALGFEQMKPGALGAVFTDRPSAFDDFDAAADKLVDAPGVPLALRYFGGAGLSHMKKYGTPLAPLPRCARRPAVTPRTTRWRCSARKSRPTTS